MEEENKKENWEITNYWSADYKEFMIEIHRDCGGKFVKIGEWYPEEGFSTSSIIDQKCDKCGKMRKVKTDAGSKIYIKDIAQNNSGREIQNANLAPRWKPGQSGNPNGKPKEAFSLKTKIIKALQEKVKKNGELTYADLFTSIGLKRATSGNYNFWKTILDHIDGMPRQAIDVNAPDFLFDLDKENKENADKLE